MRTTLTIEPDIAIEIEKTAAGLPEASHEARHQRVAAAGPAGRGGELQLPSPYRSETFDLHFRAGIDPLKLNQLVDELEVDAFVEKEAAHRP